MRIILQVISADKMALLFGQAMIQIRLRSVSRTLPDCGKSP
jgi:hypothetical protein